MINNRAKKCLPLHVCEHNNKQKHCKSCVEIAKIISPLNILFSVEYMNYDVNKPRGSPKSADTNRHLLNKLLHIDCEYKRWQRRKPVRCLYHSRNSADMFLNITPNISDKPGMYDFYGNRIFVDFTDYRIDEIGYYYLRNRPFTERYDALTRIIIFYHKDWKSVYRSLHYLAMITDNRTNCYKRLINDMNYVEARYGRFWKF